LYHCAQLDLVKLFEAFNDGLENLRRVFECECEKSVGSVNVPWSLASRACGSFPSSYDGHRTILAQMVENYRLPVNDHLTFSGTSSEERYRDMWKFVESMKCSLTFEELYPPLQSMANYRVEPGSYFLRCMFATTVTYFRLLESERRCDDVVHILDPRPMTQFNHIHSKDDILTAVVNGIFDKFCQKYEYQDFGGSRQKRALARRGDDDVDSSRVKRRKENFFSSEWSPKEKDGEANADVDDVDDHGVDENDRSVATDEQKLEEVSVDSDQESEAESPRLGLQKRSRSPVSDVETSAEELVKGALPMWDGLRKLQERIDGDEVAMRRIKFLAHDSREHEM
jgi:hypothetical protein